MESTPRRSNSARLYMTAPYYSASEIARITGGTITGRNSVLAPGTGHRRHDRSISIRIDSDAPGGLLFHSFSNDDPVEFKQRLLQQLGVDTTSRWERTPAARDRRKMPSSDTPPEARALKRWNEGVDPRGTIVEKYLASRGLQLPDEIADRVVRFHPECAWGAEDKSVIYVPAMLTLFRNVHTDEPVAIERTRLTRGGKKVDRKTLGRPGNCAAIKIDADADVIEGLTVGEGFETCLTARQLGQRPVWASGSVNRISAFPVLAGIDAITLLAEAGEPSERAIEACASRWHEAGRDVTIIEPRVGSDLNDALRETRVTQ